ncbi:hypothetical protein [Jiangella alkaliphila]|uniref:Uncharacterized protein n=1 Tax=Jiangella alkaliphila TaxID=419479 RepID=A0A1H2IFP5_9ACTN|nr:hypothetical protein [Jiangella alkaliphila]SDU42970.1 hypothetical protein SAMN04488563_1683 [Jiangella alkaliphila]
MYEGALPTTGAGVAVAGGATGLSWVLAIGVALVVIGITATRLTRRSRGRA